MAFHEENSILVISNDQLISLSEVATEIKIESVVSAVRNIVKKRAWGGSTKAATTRYTCS